MKVFKKLLSALLVAVMLVGVTPLSEIDFSTINASALSASGNCGESAYYTFDENSKELIISGNGAIEYMAFAHNKSIKSVVIEDGIINIGSNAFYGCENLTSVLIADSVTIINKEAFRGCENLKSIFIPDSITNIEDFAFYCCTNLTNIIIPNSVSSIGEYAFDGTEYYNDESNWENDVLYIGNHLIDAKSTISGAYEIKVGTITIADMALAWLDNLTSITIPSSVINIRKVAFPGCKNLTNIKVNEGNTVYDSRNNCNAIIETETNTLISGCKNTVIPNSVTSIGSNAFNTHTSLTNITIPDSVTSIDNAAFYKCSGLTSITIGTGTTSIGAWAFGNCIGLTSIAILGSIKNINERTFYNCTSLTSVTMPDSVTSIGEFAFQLCTSLTSITIPNSVTSIGEGAFYGCTGLTSITIDIGVTNIGEMAFAFCTRLTSITIPDSVTSIGEGAFGYCTGLTSITIPKSVTDIYMEAFYECANLSDVYYTGSEEDWNKINIDNTDNGNEDLLNATIHFNYVPKHDCSLNLKHVVEASTCKKAGCEYDICTVCDTKFNEKTLPLADHTWGDWKVTKEPTTTEEGSKERKCSVCEKVETETIDKLSGCAHKWKTITAPASCIVVGMEYEICTECGEICNEKTIPMTDHAWSEWTVVTEPTTTSEGLKERTCKVCGKTETETIAKLKALIDSETGIEIAYEDEFDDGTQIKVEEKFDGDSFQLINNNYGETRTRIFDISTIRGGEKVQPKGEITVRIPLPADFNPEKVFVTYVDSNNGKVTKLDCEVKDGYIVFKTNHFSYYAIVEQTGGVESVSISNVTMDYKSSKTLNPEIVAADGAEYTITYSSDSKNVTVDENGKIYGAKRGSANITVTVTDSQGNTVTDTCKVEVKYTWWQWLIKIVLFGWIWY